MGTERSETSTPVHVRKIGHIVFRVSDIERSTRFWTDVMGFQLCDRNEMGMVFLRYGADHHNIGLASVKEGESFSEGKSMGFMHCAMEVASVTELFKIRDFLRLKGVPIVFEGRRGAGADGAARSRCDHVRRSAPQVLRSRRSIAETAKDVP